MTETMNLSVGDRVVYARHGAGVVRSVTERQVLGRTEAYFEIELQEGGMRVHVPVERAGALGLRPASTPDDMPALLAVLREPDLDLPGSFQARYRREQTILEEGDLHEVTRLVATLARRDIQRGLPDSEHAILNEAKRRLGTELAAALTLDDAAAKAHLERVLGDLLAGVQRVTNDTAEEPDPPSHNPSPMDR